MAAERGDGHDWQKGLGMDCCDCRGGNIGACRVLKLANGVGKRFERIQLRQLFEHV